MLLLAHCFCWEVCKVAVLLSLQTRPRAFDTLGRLGSLSLVTLVVLPWFDRDPLVQGRYSSVGGRLKSSIVLVGNDLALSGYRIVCSQNKMGGLVDCSEMDFGEHDPSI